MSEPGVLGGCIQGRSGQVEAGAFVVVGLHFGLQSGEDSQALSVALEPAAICCELVERLFAVVSKGGWPRSWARQATSTRSGSHPMA